MTCQKCRAPLRLDPSLESLNPATFELLVGSGKSQSESAPSKPRLPYPSERLHTYNDASQNAGPPLFKRTAPTPRREHGRTGKDDTNGKASAFKSSTENPAAMSFVMLTESQMQPGPNAATPDTNSSRLPPASSAKPTQSVDGKTENLSSQIEKHERLFEILSARSDIDHPICVECTDLLIAGLNARLSAATKERDAYISFLREQQQNGPTDEEVEQARRDRDAAKEVEEASFAELRALEDEQAKLEDELAELALESAQLDAEEAEYWQSRNAFDARLASAREARDALNAGLEHDARQLERLQRTNVYNDTFCIGHDGHFGTINGLRLGRLPPPHHVEWAEINAAWGLAAFLLVTVADRLGFAFSGYMINPRGSTTTIDRLAEDGPGSANQSRMTSRRPSSPGGSLASTTATLASAAPTSSTRAARLELFSSGGLPLGQQLLHRRFNEAMVAFLECVRQLGRFVEQQDARTPSGEGPRARDGGLRLPYAIERDRIHGVSIKLGASTDEAWTSACKYTLTCCKFLLAHASNVAATPRR